MGAPESLKVDVRDLPYITLSAVARVAGWIVLLALFLLVAPFVLEKFEDAEEYAWTEPIFEGHELLMATAGTRLRENFPTRIGGEDRTEWVLFAGILIVGYLVGRAGGFARANMYYRRMRQEVEAWKSEMGIEKGTVAEAELEEKVKELADSAKTSDREELLKIFAETKRKLADMGRELAFLSIDVVGSTEMKQNEDPAAAQYDFIEYRKFVEEILQARGVLKASWTPDGIMCCFSTVDTAVQAGKDVIRGLERFNSEVKLMNRDFTVRCGVNSGYVYFDDATPLDQIADRVIDIAGHMQKYAEPNTVAVAKNIVEPLENRTGFQATDKIVDGYEVYSWKHGTDAPSNGDEGRSQAVEEA